MILTRTVKIKLLLNPGLLESTFSACNACFNFIAEFGFKDKNFNSVDLHNKTYHYCRDTFALPSELVSQTRMVAAEAIKAVILTGRKKHKTFKCPVAKSNSIRLSKNSFNIWFDRNEASILTKEGRIKCPIKVGDYFKEYISWRRKGATLTYKKQDKFAYLNITFEKEVSDVIPDNTKVLGIDRGVVNIATCSDGRIFSGEEIFKIKNRYQNLRARLQACGSKSAKRHLRKLRAKENRFVKDKNHCISKSIISPLEPGTVIVLEKLKGIRDRSKQFRKKERAKINAWPFFQLEMFLTYKALSANCKIAYVDARYTSQKCSQCGHIDRSNRKDQAHFKCKHCSFELNADLNAAVNIANNFRAAVNQPIVAVSNN